MASSKTRTGFKVGNLAPNHLPQLIVSWKPSACTDMGDLGGHGLGTSSLGVLGAGDPPFF